MKRIYSMLAISICTCLIVSVSESASANPLELPHGWRYPTPNEIEADWRNQDPSSFLTVKADFNGDGTADQARLLISENGNKLGLFVFLANRGAAAREVFLLDSIEKAMFGVMGIARVRPGVYETACGKGYWDCGPDEEPRVHIRHDAIEYFKYESASSYFYWDDKNGRFSRTWISD